MEPQPRGVPGKVSLRESLSQFARKRDAATVCLDSSQLLKGRWQFDRGMSILRVTHGRDVRASLKMHRYAITGVVRPSMSLFRALPKEGWIQSAGIHSALAGNNFFSGSIVTM